MSPQYEATPNVLREWQVSHVEWQGPGMTLGEQIWFSNQTPSDSWHGSSQTRADLGSGCFADVGAGSWQCAAVASEEPPVA